MEPSDETLRGSNFAHQFGHQLPPIHKHRVDGTIVYWGGAENILRTIKDALHQNRLATLIEEENGDQLFFHQPCYAHALHLAVMDTLKGVRVTEEQVKFRRRRGGENEEEQPPEAETIEDTTHLVEVETPDEGEDAASGTEVRSNKIHFSLNLQYDTDFYLSGSERVDHELNEFSLRK